MTVGDIPRGPAEHMSGGGAEKMIGEYADLSRQEGMMRLYESFERKFSDFRKATDQRFTVLAGVVGGTHGAMKSLIEELQKANTPAPDAPDADTFFGKAQIKIAKANKAFRKAEMDEDEDSRDERKSRLVEIADTLKSASNLLRKADDEEKPKEDEVEKAMTALKALKGKVAEALALITKAGGDEEKRA